MSAFTINVGGDIFADVSHVEDTVTVIAHGVNIRSVMGGFAGLIDKKFPDDAALYREACVDGYLRAGFTHITGTDDAPEGPNLWIAHVASQVEPGPDAKVGLLISALNDMYSHLTAYLSEQFYDRIHVDVRLPLIGGGIGGIDPLVSAAVIRTSAERVVSDGYDIATTLYLLDSDPHTEAVVAAVGSES